MTTILLRGLTRPARAHNTRIVSNVGVWWRALAPTPPTTTRHASASDRSSSSPSPPSPSSPSPSSSLSAEASNIQYTIENVPGDLADELSDHLLAAGALSATILEHRPAGADEQEIFKERWGQSEFWKTCSVQCCFLFLDSDDLDDLDDLDDGNDHRFTSIIDTALEWLDADPAVLEGLRVSEGEIIKPQNWQQAILDEYQEIQIADNLRIVPTWCVQTPHTDDDDDEYEYDDDDDKPNANANANAAAATDVILNPGIAFGTGDHPTTRMCLQYLNTLRNANLASLLDYGTGSGLLAIAALVLNVADTAHGTDIEPLSIKASLHNATLNHVAHRFTAQLVSEEAHGEDDDDDDDDDDASPPTYDVITANILQGPLKSLAPHLASKSHPGTLLALSGITNGQAAEVQAAYESTGFKQWNVIREEDNEWVVLTAIYNPTTQTTTNE